MKKQLLLILSFVAAGYAANLSIVSRDKQFPSVAVAAPGTTQDLISASTSLETTFVKLDKTDFDKALETTPEYYADCVENKIKTYPGNIKSSWYTAVLPPNITPKAFLEKIKKNYEHYFSSGQKAEHSEHTGRPHRRVADSLHMQQAHGRIPHHLHQIWIGSKPLPKQYKKYQAAWRKLHPDWTYTFWTNSAVAQHNWSSPLVKRAYRKAQNITAKADILRFDILYQNGGVYLDIDTEPIKKLDSLTNNFDFFAILYGPHKGTLVIDTFFIGAIPKHPILAKTLKNIENFYKRPPDLSAITKQKKFVHNLSMGVMPLTHAVCELLNNSGSRNIILPMAYFSHHKKTHYSYGIHYPQRAWSSQAAKPSYAKAT